MAFKLYGPQNTLLFPARSYRQQVTTSPICSFFIHITDVLLHGMKLTDAHMDMLVPACEERLSRLDEARLAEFEEAMERIFMRYIRTQWKTFDAGGGFSALTGREILNDNSSEQGEKALSPHTDNETPALEDSDSLRASMSTNVAFDENLVSCDRSDAPCNGMERIDTNLLPLPPSCLSDKPLSNEDSLVNTDTFLNHDGDGNSFFATADEMSIDFSLEDPDMTSEQLAEGRRADSRQAEDVPAGFLRTYLEKLRHQRRVEDTTIDVAAPASNGQLENWGELFKRHTIVESLCGHTDHMENVIPGYLDTWTADRSLHLLPLHQELLRPSSCSLTHS